MYELKNNDLENLIEKLPFFLYKHLTSHKYKNQLIEIILDLGRKPEARFRIGPEYLSQKLISWQDLDYTTKQIGKFSHENRAGVERTLHRISCIRNRQFLINGLTCRIGRVIFGTISIIRDLLESGNSILILGKPGVGKTTIIREIARVLADEMEKRVIIIDTSNEIAGESDIPHPGIGRSRIMQVARPELQHQIMVEAIENHMPEIIVIDEIGTELEVLTATNIAEKGIQLVGTTHGHCLENLVKNPPLSNLIGGIEYVTLSDDEAKRRRSQKSILERKAYPTFEIVIEINSQEYWTVHDNVKNSIDFLLRKNLIINQTRQISFGNKIKIRCERTLSNYNSYVGSNDELNVKKWYIKNFVETSNTLSLTLKTINIYLYSLPVNLLKEGLLKMKSRYILTNEIYNASLIFALKSHLKQNPHLKILARNKNIPVYVLDRINLYEIQNLIKEIE